VVLGRRGDVTIPPPAQAAPPKSVTSRWR